MFKNLFKAKQRERKEKKEISSITAASFVVRANLEDLKDKWDSMKSDIINFDEAFINSNDSWVKYEMMLAAIGADFVALYNLFPKDEADILFRSMITFLGEMDDVGEVSVEAVEEYYYHAQQAIEQNENPLEFVISVLCDRLEVPNNETGPLTMIGLMNSISMLIGKWKWIQQNFIISDDQ